MWCGSAIILANTGFSFSWRLVRAGETLGLAIILADTGSGYSRRLARAAETLSGREKS